MMYGLYAAQIFGWPVGHTNIYGDYESPKDHLRPTGCTTTILHNGFRFDHLVLLFNLYIRSLLPQQCWLWGVGERDDMLQLQNVYISS